MGGKLIVADSHAISADAIASLLASEYDVRGVLYDAPTLLNAVRREQPDVVVQGMLWEGITGLRSFRKFAAPRQKPKLSSSQCTRTPHSPWKSSRLGHLPMS